MKSLKRAITYWVPELILCTSERCDRVSRYGDLGPYRVIRTRIHIFYLCKRKIK